MRECTDRSAVGTCEGTREAIRSAAAISGAWRGLDSISVSESPSTSELETTSRGAVEDAGDAISWLLVGSDGISGRAVGRTSPRVSGVDGIAGAGCAPVLSVTANGVTFRSVIDSEGAAFVSRLSETGVAAGEASDGTGDRCTAAGRGVSSIGVRLGAGSVSVSEISRTSGLGTTDRPLRDGSGDRCTVEDAGDFAACGWEDSSSRVGISSDGISGRAAERISPMISAPRTGVVGIEGAVSAPALSVTSGEATSRNVSDSDGTALVFRFSETGVATGGTGDGARDRCTTSAEASTRGSTDRSTAGTCKESLSAAR